MDVFIVRSTDEYPKSMAFFGKMETSNTHSFLEIRFSDENINIFIVKTKINY